MPIKRYSEFDRDITITHRELMDAVIEATRLVSLRYIPDTNGEFIHESLFAALIYAEFREILISWQECLPDANDEDEEDED